LTSSSLAQLLPSPHHAGVYKKEEKYEILFFFSSLHLIEEQRNKLKMNEACLCKFGAMMQVT
jgi:hypothetical protein